MSVPQGWQPPVAAQRQPPPGAHPGPHPEPRLYPLILRTWDFRWWKPVVGILVLVLGSLVVVPIVLMPVLAVAVALEGGSQPFGDRFLAATSLKSVSPASMLYLNLTLASLTLLAMGIVRFLHRLRPRWLSSVLPGMRWRFFGACLGLSVIALVVSLLVGALLPHDPNSFPGTAQLPTGRLLASAIVIVLTTPLQALGEEYGFRGYLMQAFGSLTHAVTESLGLSAKWATRITVAVALMVTSGLFALAHGTQNFPLFFDRFAFGMMAGLVVILVGGLEAGIALHVLNNLLAFGIAIAYNQLDSTLTVSEASWWQLPVTIAQNGVYLVLVLLVARRMGLRNTTAPEVIERVPQRLG